MLYIFNNEILHASERPQLGLTNLFSNVTSGNPIYILYMVNLKLVSDVYLFRYPFAYSKPVFAKRDDHKIFVDTLCQTLQNLSFIGWEATMALNLNSCNTLSSIFFKRYSQSHHKTQHNTPYN